MLALVGQVVPVLQAGLSPDQATREQAEHHFKQLGSTVLGAFPATHAPFRRPHFPAVADTAQRATLLRVRARAAATQHPSGWLSYPSRCKSITDSH